MIPHNKPTLEKDDLRSVQETLASGWIAPGEKTKKFENELKTFIGGKEGGAVAVNSGTAALHLALVALGIKEGDEVIVPTYVCSAVLNAVSYVRANPVIVDINNNDFNISYKETAKKITEKTKAIIVPHMYGIPADIDRFVGLGIPIIEDCAQSIGAKFRKNSVGTFGDVAVFSFYATKMMTTGNGGAIYSKKNEIVEAINDLVDFDQRPSYKVRYNYHLSDFQSSIGISQLKKLPSFINKRKAIAYEYDEILAGKKDVCRTIVPETKQNIWYRYVLISKKDNDNIKKEFMKKGISVINPVEDWELLHNYVHLDKKEFPNAEAIAKRTISIPIHPSLSDDEISCIKNAIDKLYS